MSQSKFSVPASPAVQAVGDVLRAELKKDGFTDFIFIAIRKRPDGTADQFVDAATSIEALGNIIGGLLIRSVSGPDAAKIMHVLVSHEAIREHIGIPAPDEPEPQDATRPKKEWMN